MDLFNADSDLLLECDEVIVRMADGKEHEVSVDTARRADKTILLKLNSVGDRDRAEELRGATIGLRRNQLPELPEGEFYFCDVEGAEVRLQGKRVGVVERLVEYPSLVALSIRKDDGATLEVPLTEDFVERVDVAGRVVLLSSVEGLS